MPSATAAPAPTTKARMYFLTTISTSLLTDRQVGDLMLRASQRAERYTPTHQCCAGRRPNSPSHDWTSPKCHDVTDGQRRRRVSMRFVVVARFARKCAECTRPVTLRQALHTNGSRSPERSPAVAVTQPLFTVPR